MKESDIQRNIIKTLEAMGCYVVNVVSPTKAGTPDIVLCHPDCKGRFIGLEVKIKGKKPTELQYHHLKRIREAGGIGLWVTSVSDALAQIGSAVYGYD